MCFYSWEIYNNIIKTIKYVVECVDYNKRISGEYLRGTNTLWMV